MVRLGVLGVSPGNGHPFSFSAILNGYNAEAFGKTEWLPILNYLRKQDSADLAQFNARVTHCWTQDKAQTRSLSEACLIEHCVDNYQDMIGKVDGVLLARDDYSEHRTMAEPFLQAGIPVFVDKPLTDNVDDYRWFRPYAEKGLLFTTSGLRYARELDNLRTELSQFGKIKLIKASIINDWNKYGIHMVDAIQGLGVAEPQFVESHSEHFDSMTIGLSDGGIVKIDCLGPEIKVFNIQVFGTECVSTVDISDNFSAFRRSLFKFVKQVETGQPSIPLHSLDMSLLTLIAGNLAKSSGQRIYIKDLLANIQGD